jgi:prevent-host-death family protein
VKASRVRPITDLKNRTKELVHEIADGGEAVIITQNGKPKVVVMDVKEHDRLHDTLAMLKLLAQSQDHLAKTGQVHTSTEVRRRAQIVFERAKRR